MGGESSGGENPGVGQGQKNTARCSIAEHMYREAGGGRQQLFHTSLEIEASHLARGDGRALERV